MRPNSPHVWDLSDGYCQAHRDFCDMVVDERVADDAPVPAEDIIFVQADAADYAFPDVSDDDADGWGL